MADRVLFIGAGGSGGATLHFLYNELETQLRELGWQEGMPDAWQFLHVDATSYPDVGNRDVSPVLKDGKHYLPLAARETKYEDYTYRLLNNPDVAGGWLPSPAAAAQKIYLGAGQRRAIGRVLVLESMERIYLRVKDLVEETTSRESLSQLSRLNQSIFNLPANSQSDIQVFVIASLGGGSGSGMHQDISLMLRAAFLSEGQHVSVLYTPDVFDSISQGFSTGIAPNSLAGISELLSANFAERGLSSSELGALRSVPVNQFQPGPRSAHRIFLQGRSNGDITLDTPDDVYRSTARGLTAILLNTEIYEGFKSYEITNTNAATMEPSLLSAKALTSVNPLGTTAFGYANISLGMSAFKEYGARRLAAKVIQQVLDTNSNAARLRSKKDEQFIRDATAFAEASGLNETLAGPNSPVGGLSSAWISPDPLVKELKVILEKVADVASKLTQAASGQGKDVLANHKLAFIKALDIHIGDATERLLVKTIASIATDGADLTIQYLAQLEMDLISASQKWVSDSGSRPTQSSVRKFQAPQSSQKPNKIGKVVGAIRGDSASQAEPTNNLAQTLAGVLTPLRTEFEEYQKKTMAYALAGVGVNVVKPIREALEGGRRDLVGRLESDVALKVQIEMWPSETSESLIKAAKNEIFLIEDSEFKANFENLLESALLGLEDNPLNTYKDGQEKIKSSSRPDRNPSYIDVRDRAVFEILGGIKSTVDGETPYWPTARHGDPELRTCGRFLVSHHWEPGFITDSVPSLVSVTDTNTRDCLKIDFRVDPVVLLRDSREWMSTRTGIDSYTNMSISDFLNAKTGDSRQRQNDFVSKFATALSMSRPMTKLNKDAYREFHDGNPGEPKITVSSIPLDKGSEEGRKIISLLQKAEVEPDRIPMSSDSKVSEIHFTSYTGNLVHPVVMENVMGPIVREWSGQTSKQVNDPIFWNARRAHRLPSFVPLSEDVVHWIVKGWNLARCTGLISDVSTENFLDDDQPLTLNFENQVFQFPTRLLTAPTRLSQLFPALLESFSVALIDLASGTPETIEVYKKLSEIGKDAPRYISEFKSKGSIGGTMLDTKIGSSGDQRINLLHEEIESRINGLVELQSEASGRSDDKDIFDLTWELADVSLSTLRELLSEVTSPQASKTLKA